MPNPILLIWKRSPFLRLLLFFSIGIILNIHFSISSSYWYLLCGTGFLTLFVFFFIKDYEKFRLSWISGVAAALLLMGLGAIYAQLSDVRNNNRWIGNNYTGKEYLLVTLQEDLVEKNKSFKALAKVNKVIANENTHPVKGKMILYFEKDTVAPPLQYGSQIIIHQPIQEIQNAGNPGGFDYKKYCLFEGITHQAFLKPANYEILSSENKNGFQQFIINTRNWVLSILRSYIKEEKELGLAEALLIGYKDDLDQTLLQSYTNTGVVHVIAISGLHLGIIYLLLVRLLMPLKRRKETKWLVPIIIIASLWIFSILAGAQPSILRAAVMFSCIVIGQSFSKRTSIYNTLALSAFILLLINPFWLWNVGFQLSYAAVTSIIIFQRSIYDWFYFPNKIVNFFWELTSVTIAAQLLTTPISIYHFHQFPTYFLISNFVAVPLSSLILIGEIVLCAVSFIPLIASWLGSALSYSIQVLNGFIENIEQMPFALWDGLQISIAQAITLLFIICLIAYWLMEKYKPALMMGLLGVLLFLGIRSYSFYQANRQQKIIVYNVPQKTAIDFIDGRNYNFKGDSSLLEDAFLRNFHLKPSRIKHRIATKSNKIPDSINYYFFNSHSIIFINEQTHLGSDTIRPTVDMAVISGNPRLYMKTLYQKLDIKQIVFDGSCPAWKIKLWEKDCDSLAIQHHNVKTKGAFVMNIR